MYDPALGRFFTPDPLAEKFYSYTPYNYALNNPVRLIDPDGNAALDPNKLRESINSAYAEWGMKDTKNGTCNYAVNHAFNKYTGGKLKGSADDIYNFMHSKGNVRNGGDWRKLEVNKIKGFQSVIDLAKQGHFVVAIMHSSNSKDGSKHGHISVIRPEDMVSTSNWKFNIPQTLEANRASTEQKLSFGWNSQYDPFSDIEYFVYDPSELILTSDDFAEFAVWDNLVGTLKAPETKEEYEKYKKYEAYQTLMNIFKEQSKRLREQSKMPRLESGH